MGIDKSLTDDFPSVDINGVKYHYGRDTMYGQYLVENAEYAKDYWCFDKREDLVAFLVNLPESADRDLFRKKYPHWQNVTHEERMAMMEEHRADLRKLMEEKQKDGSADYFNVLQFDEEGSGYYTAFASPRLRPHGDNITVEVCEQQDGDRNGLLIELSAEPDYDKPERGVFRVQRQQALQLASVLIQAARYIEDRLPEPSADTKEE